MSWKEFDREIDRGPASSVFAIWKIVLLILLLGIITAVTVTAISRPADLINKTFEADNVIYNYEYFKKTHEEIKGLDVMIRSAKASVRTFKEEAGPRDQWYREDREEYSRLRAVLEGLKQERAAAASDYNARARMANRSIFKGNDTPNHIPAE